MCASFGWRTFCFTKEDYKKATKAKKGTFISKPYLEGVNIIFT